MSQNSENSQKTADRSPWYSEMTRYHWIVVILCTCGWTFDCFDQQLFALARVPAVAELLDVPENDPLVGYWGGWATSLMLIGWATGGIFFGIWADKFGRIRIMCITLALYALFTGLCGMAQTLPQFLFFRFLVGLGVGGQFAVCATVIAESLTNKSRPYALGAMQAFSACGNVAAAVVMFVIGQLVLINILSGSPWRWAFYVGFLPLILVYLNAKYLKEPEAWKKSKAEEAAGGHKTGSILELFGDRVICYRVVMGMLLATVGVIGFWGIMTFAIDLNRAIFVPQMQAAALQELNITLAPEDETYMKWQEAVVKGRYNALLTGEAKWHVTHVHDAAGAYVPLALVETGLNDYAFISLPVTVAQQATAGELKDKKAILAALNDAVPGEMRDKVAGYQKLVRTKVNNIASLTSLLTNLGGFFGVFSFTMITTRIGRRKTFTLFLSAAMLSILGVFLLVKSITTLCIFVPLMGFSIVSLMGGYTIYFPELFPTRLRSTAVSFCYNVGRYLAAVGPGVFGILTAMFYVEGDPAHQFRMAGAWMCPIFLVGIVIIWLLPETHGKPLPE